MFVRLFQMFWFFVARIRLTQGLRRKITGISSLFAVVWSIELKGAIFGDAYALSPYVTIVLILYFVVDVYDRNELLEVLSG